MTVTNANRQAGEGGLAFAGVEAGEVGIVEYGTQFVTEQKRRMTPSGKAAWATWTVFSGMTGKTAGCNDMQLRQAKRQNSVIWYIGSACGREVNSPAVSQSAGEPVLHSHFQ